MADVATLGIKFEAQPVSPEKLAGPVVSMAAQAGGAGGGGGGAGGGSGPPVVLNGGGAADDDGESAGGGDVRSIGQRVYGYVAKVLESLKSLNPGAVQDELSQIDRIQGEWQALLRSRREEMEERYKQQRELFKNQDFDALSAIMGTSSIDKMREMLDEAKDQARGRFFLELGDEFDMLAKSVGLSDTNKRAFFARRERELNAEQEGQQEEESSKPRFQRWAGAANQWAGGGAIGMAAGAAAGATSLAASVGAAIPGMMGPGVGMAASIGAMDAGGVGRGLAGVASQLPVFGSAIGFVTSSLGNLNDALHASAERLSAWSPLLLTQLINQDLRRMERDRDRAERFGPQIAQTENARFQLEMKFQDLIDKQMPQLVKLGESGLKLAQSLEPVFNLLGEILGKVANVSSEGLDFLTQGWQGVFDGIFSATQQIAQNTTPQQPNTGADEFIDQLVFDSVETLINQGRLNEPVAPRPQASFP